MTVQALTADYIQAHQALLADFIFKSVRNANYTENFQHEDAEKKSSDLTGYVQEGKAIVFGAFEGEEQIGFIWAYPFPFRTQTDRVYVSILYVNEQYRGMKIGQQLLTAVEQRAKELGFHSVFLHTDATNTGAVRFYHNNGFSDERIQFVKEL